MRHAYMVKLSCFSILLFNWGIILSQVPANKPNSITQTPALSGFVITPEDFLPGKINYIRTREGIKPINDITLFNTSPYTDVKESTGYLDGMGRSIQVVERQKSPSAKDVVTFKVLDHAGREANTYLPFAMINGDRVNNGAYKTTQFSAQASFYQNTTLNPGFLGEQVYNGLIEYEQSPLNRQIKTYSAGNSWLGSATATSQRAQVTEYLSNVENDDVRIWKINSNQLTYDAGGDANTNIPVSSAPYQPGRLFKKVTKDEASNVTVEYTDKNNRLILRKKQIGTIPADYTGYDGFLSTYFVYDDFEQLRFVITPKAVEAIRPNWTLTTAIVDGLCFRYEFDLRNREIAKKMPGQGWTYMIYDNRDRLVFVQDANMRSKNQWLATLYDVINRPVMTGIMTYVGNAGTLQTTTTANTKKPVVPNPPSGLQDHLPLQGEKSGTHEATKSITLIPEFFTTPNAEFAAIVHPDPSAPNFETQTFNGHTVNKNPIPTGAVFIPLSMTFYDNYDWAGKTYTTAYNNKLNDVGTNPNAEQLPAEASKDASGLITGTRIRVIEDPNNLSVGNWLTTTNFYDDKGRLVQVQSDNYKGGNDIIVNRYDFTGKILGVYVVRDNPAVAIVERYTKMKTVTEYDHVGRVKQVWKTINDDDAKKALIVKNEYDELGNLRKKHLGSKFDPQTNAYTTNPVETLDYTYNIRGWLKGINKDYVNNIGSEVNNRWFGMELNYDWGFDYSQYNGAITGTKWRSKGNGIQRAIGYRYDKINRLLSGDFSQKNGGAYIDDAVVNYDMMMGDGQEPVTAYDENGNIKRMKQWGLVLNNSPVIDDLRYTYEPNSNRLKSVIDFNNNEQTKLGDFKTSASHPQKTQKSNYIANQASVDINTIQDYTYDANGNLITDLNREIGSSSLGGIEYNHLNLPWKIKIKTGSVEKGTITYIYDALGNKLEKRVHEEPAASNNNLQRNSAVTYIGTTVYKATSAPGSNTLGTPVLEFIKHEEGRTRYIPASGSVTASFQHDYFVKDHLGNIRMVLTSEQRQDIYQAGFEPDLRNFETQLFGDKVNTTLSVKPTGFDSNNDNDWVSRVEGTLATNRVGPGVVLKVMAGDKFKARTFAWYQPTGMDYSVDPLLTNIVTNLLAQLAPGVSGISKGAPNQHITEALLQPGMEDFLDDHTTQSNRPKAYLNWILLDEEQFKKVDNCSNFIQVGQINNAEPSLLLEANNGNEIEITKNGYLYVYVSNESKGNVYFDDIRVEHIHGPLLEETHYYPFGLTMASISSKSNKPQYSKNSNGYNGNELQVGEFYDGSGLEMYDFNARTYDPQIGRFIQTDPLLEEGQTSWSSYQFAYNNPAQFSDPDGKIPVVIAIILIKFAVGALVEYGSQVYDNYQEGATGIDAWTPQGLNSWLKIGLNGVTSAIDPSGGFWKKAAITLVSNLAESIGGQLLDEDNKEGITFEKTLADLVVMNVASFIKIDYSIKVEKLEDAAERAERIARNNPKPSRDLAATEARERAIYEKKLNEAQMTASTEFAEAMLGKIADDILESKAQSAKTARIQMEYQQRAASQMIIDNTAVSNPRNFSQRRR